MRPADFLASPRRQILGLALLLAITAILFGGASRLDLVAPIVPRLTAVLLIAWIGWNTLPMLGNPGRAVWWFWGALFALPLVQLIPLPWSVWTALPGRELARDIYRSIGEQPWAPISLTPSRTLNGLLALLPAFAIFLATLRLNDRARDLLLKTVCVLAVASAGIGLLQVGAGPDSPLYFYAITNADSGVGWFSNANHQSLMLCSGIVLLFYWAAGLVTDRRRLPWGQFAVAGGALVLMLVCLPLTSSRAGVLLAPVALATGVAMLPRKQLGMTGRRFWIGSIGATLILIGIFLGFGFDRTFGPGGVGGVFADARGRNIGDFARIAATYFPFGSGLGSFDPVYRIFEDVSSIQLNYLNNAHNEPAQILIEAGLWGVALMAFFLIWFAQHAVRLVRSPPYEARQRRQATASIAIITMLLLHSLVDYPLRTASLSMLFGLCAAILAVRPAIVTGRGRGLALTEWLEHRAEAGFSFSSADERHMTKV